MEGTYGYNEIRKVAFFGLEFGEAAAQAGGAQGALAKAGCFLQLMDDVLSILTLDLKALEAEWNDMGDDDWRGLLDECKAEFALEDGGSEAMIEDAFASAMRIIEGAAGLAKLWRSSPDQAA